MNNDLINRQALWNQICTFFGFDKSKPYGGLKPDVISIMGMLDEAPAVNAQPVVFGRWIYSHHHNQELYYECSECGFERDMSISFGKAVTCPNCGAVIKEDATNAH